MVVKAIFLGSLLLASTSALRAEDEVQTSASDALLIFKEANKELTRLNSVLPVCDLSKEKNCEQREFCDFLSQNKNNYQIYKNDEGEYIPNFALYGIDASLKNCAQVSSQSELILNPIPKADLGKVEKAKLYKALQESIKKNGEQEIMSKLEYARSEIVLEKAEKGTEMDEFDRYKILRDPKAGKELIINELSEVESKAGVKFSEETREKYISFHSYTPPIFEIKEEEAKPSLEPVWKSPVADPFMDISLLTLGSEAEVKEQKAKYQKRLDKTYDTFLEAQKDLIAIIESKKDKIGKKATESILERLKTVNMNEETDSVMCVAPNAFYNPQDHKITICRQLLMLPKESVKSIIAHELGHSFDPCVISGELNSMKEDKDKNPLADILPTKNDKLKPSNYKKSESIFIADVMEMLPSSSQTKAKKIPFSDNPFSSLISCLSSPKSMGARTPDYTTLEKNLNLAIGEMEAGGATKKSSPEYAQLLKIKSNFNDIKKSKYACSFIPGTGFTEIQEAFADWVAGEVVASDLAKAKPEKKRAIAFESMAFFLGMDCKNLSPELSKATKATLKSCNSDASVAINSGFSGDITVLSQVAQRSADPHPRTFKRIDNLFMAQPEIREAMGCNSKRFPSQGAQRCEF